MAKNNISGIQLKSTKSRYIEDAGESTRIDIQLGFREIHVIREDDVSVVEIPKLDIISSINVPLQPTSPIRVGVDVNLGDIRCNLVMSRLKPLMQLKTSKKKNTVIREETSKTPPIVENSQSNQSKPIMWTCTLSGPEMTIVIYNLNGLPVYRGCCQSSHILANNKSNTGTCAHMELGEINLHMADEYQEFLKESLIGVETNRGLLMHIAKISLELGGKSMDQDGPKSIMVLSVDLTGMGIYLTLKRIEPLISILLSFKSSTKSKQPSSNKPVQSGGHSSKPSGKGIRIIKFNMDRCFVIFCSDVSVDNTFVADPKRVNYGSQGGIVTISESADGTTRTAKIMSTSSDEEDLTVNYSVSLEIIRFSLSVNKDKQSVQIDLEKAQSLYQEHMRGNLLGTKVALLDMLNVKFVRRSGGLKEIDICSLFSATDITVRWEPDMHIALFELMLRMKLLVQNQTIQEHDDSGVVQGSEIEHKKETSTDVQSDKQKKKKESVFAIDVQMLSIYAEAGDGVDCMVQVQSIFSENASIGVLLEGLLLKFNDARIFSSSRMQVSRVPVAKTGTPKKQSEASTTWDWVVQALDVHVCLPFRLELRAIDDAVEEMLRALKLITAAKTNMLFPKKKESVKPKKPSSSKFGCVRLCIRKLSIDIEEEPLQGWLDEHYHLMKTEARELAVRLNFFDEVISGGSQSPGTDNSSNPISDEKMNFKGEDIDLQDTSAILKMRHEIYKNSFNSYYKACQKLVISEGSGACKVGFQSGFKPSTCRTSLFSISATDLDVSLTKIQGGETGMIEQIQKLDPVSRKYNIPFSRMYGCNILLRTASLSVQIRNYTYPLLSATSGRCEGRLVLAQQATCFQAQVTQDVYVGRWRKVCMLRSASGTTPPMKTYLDLPLHFQKGQVSYGVGYEPSFTDLSYAFTVALRRANLSVRNPNPPVQPPKKEKSLPWWDEMRNYVHGKTSLSFSETSWNILATTDPYEKSEKLQLVTDLMEIHQTDGRINVSSKGFKVMMSSLESLLNNRGLKPPTGTPTCFLEAPAFSLEVTMDWDCESGEPLNHFLFALPNEGVAREFIYDPFRSISLSLRWNLSLQPCLPSSQNQSRSSTLGENNSVDGAASDSPNKAKNASVDSPTITAGSHDFSWLLKFWNLNYLPPQKLRYFSRWPRFGVPRIPRSGNLSLDRVITEFMFRIDSSPTCLRHLPLDEDDPAKGLTFKMSKLKFELCFGRGRQKFTFDCKRDLLEIVYLGLDLQTLKVYINREDCPTVAKLLKLTRKSSQSATVVKGSSERHRDDGFFLSSDNFTVRKQSQKADPERLLSWQEAGKRNSEKTSVRSKSEKGSESDEHTLSDPSDDDGDNVVIADNCQRIFVYGLKLLWSLENRDAIWSCFGGNAKAFQPPKPSPSRQYAQRKLVENKEETKAEMPEHNDSNPPSDSQDGSSISLKPVEEPTGSHASSSESATADKKPLDTVVKDLVSKNESLDDSEEESRHFMVNVVEPQFNLHSEDANGRFLLAAASGRVLARSFHSVVQLGSEMIEQAIESNNVQKVESKPEMTWNRMEFSVMLEHVQAHVAPTDVDPGAGIQWLPKIRGSSPKVKRTGALLERVFMPCDMYFRYTRHKGGTSHMKVKPLKELAFNSQNITATMTSRQFQVMLDVLTHLLFARFPKPPRGNLFQDDEDVEEEADAVVPDGVEEVELARVNLEQKERMHKLLLDDIKKLSLCNNGTVEKDLEKDGNFWMITGGTAALVQRLNKELVDAKKSRKEASASLRVTLKEAAQIRLLEKEKNKSPSYAMRISMQMTKVVWGMLVDGKTFAEAEINDMIYDYDRDYKDIGVSRFTTKFFVVRNCLPNAKSDMVLSAWNPPSEWGKKVMLGVDARQGAPKDGDSPIELFQAEIYPLKIYLAETMYKMIWGYLFPEEKQDSQRRQEVWKVSTAAGSRRHKKDADISKSGASAAPSNSANNQPSASSESSQASKFLSSKSNPATGSNRELRRTSSFDRSWEETVAESVANELVLQAHSSSLSSSKTAHLSVDQDEPSRSKLKESKPSKSGRPSQDDKKVGKPQDEKKPSPRKLKEFRNIHISQVELLISYEGSRFSVSDLRLLMDEFRREEFTGTWGRLFSRIKKHIVWSVLKSFTGMQGKKFKDKSQSQREVIAASVAENDPSLSDVEGLSTGNPEQLAWPRRPTDGAGDGFVTSIRGLFGTQRRKAKAFVLRTMRGEADSKQQGEWSDNDAEFSPYARQLTINKTKKLIRRHTKKLRSKGQKGMPFQKTDAPSSPAGEISPVGSDSSSGSSSFGDFYE
ncbi:hypothetical protein DCAR_0312129 [Daucus carota subsp. sativus]|uniref:FMP27/BLTP2/Hobbit GFWDK motif-containing RBG unit domain-containing protein n=2 Tax=Daucus carota subsp. sativus TaxID=79200 RepID=A0AAF1ATU8_DAUCS|nr:hypothetical protein DCAR_0312129 [Daucus carota subsp. sativus]